MQLASVRAVVTGGVSGLGLAVAQHLVANGGKVSLFDVNDDKGAAAVEALGSATARYFRTDVTDEKSVVDNVAAAREFLGGLNVAISCAGILGAGRMLGKDGPMPLQQFAGTVMVNLVGSFNVAKAAAAHMQHNEAGADGERGVIINMMVITGSLIMIGGAIAISSAVATQREHISMNDALQRECDRYDLDISEVLRDYATPEIDRINPRKWWDYAIIAAAVGVFVYLGWKARVPQLAMNLQWTGLLVFLMIAAAVGGLFALRRLSKT